MWYGILLQKHIQHLKSLKKIAKIHRVLKNKRIHFIQKTNRSPNDLFNNFFFLINLLITLRLLRKINVLDIFNVNDFFRFMLNYEVLKSWSNRSMKNAEWLKKRRIERTTKAFAIIIQKRKIFPSISDGWRNNDKIDDSLEGGGGGWTLDQRKIKLRIIDWNVELLQNRKVKFFFRINQLNFPIIKEFQPLKYIEVVFFFFFNKQQTVYQVALENIMQGECLEQWISKVMRIH